MLVVGVVKVVAIATVYGRLHGRGRKGKDHGRGEEEGRKKKRRVGKEKGQGPADAYQSSMHHFETKRLLP